MTVGCCDLWLDDTGLSPGIDGLCEHDRCDLRTWYSYTCLRFHTSDSHIILAWCCLHFLSIIYHIMMLYFAHHILLLSASSLAIRGNSTPAIVSLTPWLGRSLSLRRYESRWCGTGQAGLDVTSKDEPGNRTCEAWGSPRRSDHTLWRDCYMSCIFTGLIHESVYSYWDVNLKVVKVVIKL